MEQLEQSEQLEYRPAIRGAAARAL